MTTNIFDFVRELPPWIVLVLGVLAGGLRSVWSFVYAHTIGYAVTRISISLAVEDAESREAYIWLSCWAEKKLRGRRVNSLLLRVQTNEETYDTSSETSFDMIPAYGTYYLLHGRRLMTVEHSKYSHASVNGGRAVHSIRLQLWLCWDRSVMMAILEEARKGYEESRDKKIEFFRNDGYGGWNCSLITNRPITSVFHPPEMIDDLLEDIDTFLRSRPVYEDLGIPYRRGYLLAGPPGTGKSSLILAVASYFQLPIYLVPLRGADMSGERLTRLLDNCRKPSLVALEDVDCLKVATSRESSVADGLTMADLLNAVDGIGASEDRVLFMTANHPETLDAALTRAGRVDRRFFVDYARDAELYRFYERMSRSHAVPSWPEFRAGLPERATIADAQASAFGGRLARVKPEEETVSVS